MNPHENDPFASEVHELVKLTTIELKSILMFLLAKKPDPLTVFAEPTGPELEESESEGTTVNVVEAELPAASVACAVC